ncbi:MAG: hypothetical protein NUW37_20015 [Planctomycetes bacterium]|nr:hypothetical protein [Planctomycetota bacterium]
MDVPEPDPQPLETGIPAPMRAIMPPKTYYDLTPDEKCINIRLGQVIILLVLGFTAFVLFFPAGTKHTTVSSQRACSANLNSCGKSAIMYQTRMRYFPRATGAWFFKTLYVDEQRYIGTPNVLVCPACEDSEAEVLGAWTVSDNSKAPTPTECSYAGPSTADGSIAIGSAMGSDDHEPDLGSEDENQNHPFQGVNIMWPDAATEWIENPWGEVCRVGFPEGNKALMTLQN